ncbi:RNA polymerase sigma factor [Jiella pacifica]|uniref:Sigma-70 family RNA polymerase sigma factor n=1 Tax=Jiella pacifica TaxID=2696469 RepID=A0A6N9TFE5_9HYPH|nr:RNA polymerase sigma factor [Jiella pacifica]NDW07588.1 sigma-70 family RNA polymerase sigma factor [Jiella pacifica]
MWDVQNLFRRHAREIDRFLRRRGHSAETAADLTQDTFVRIITAAPRGKAHNPRAYLHQIARNLSVDLYRRERHVERADLTDEEFQRVADAAPGPETIVYDRQRLAIVERALQELPEPTRRAFELHRLGERTMSEVAGELGLSVSRTWTLIRRAYLHLRARLNEAEG